MSVPTRQKQSRLLDDEALSARVREIVTRHLAHLLDDELLSAVSAPRPTSVEPAWPLAVTLKKASTISGIPEMTLRDAYKRRDLAVCVYGNGSCRKRYVVLLNDLETYLRRMRRPARWEEGL